MADSSTQLVPEASLAEEPAALLQRIDQLQARLDQLQGGLAHAHRLATLGTLAAVVAHEFNNILTPIINYSQLALARPDDADLMRKSVEKSLEAGERAARICAAILDFSQDGSAAERLAVDRIPALVQEALECTARDPRRDGHTLELDFQSLAAAPDQACLTIGSTALLQVLVNLILNARRAMGRRRGRLILRAALDHGCVEIQVADTGPGVPDAIRDRIFEPFVTQRIDPTPHSVEPAGTGLGLSVCRNLLAQAGGTIRLDPPAADPPGASFRIRLPLAN